MRCHHSPYVIFLKYKTIKVGMPSVDQGLCVEEVSGTAGESGRLVHPS